MASGLLVASIYICQICIEHYTETTDVGFPFDEIGYLYGNSASTDFQTLWNLSCFSPKTVSVRDGLKLDVRLVSPCHVFFPFYVRGA